MHTTAMVKEYPVEFTKIIFNGLHVVLFETTCRPITIIFIIEFMMANKEVKGEESVLTLKNIK